MLRIIPGEYRRFSKLERKLYKPFTLVVTEEYHYYYRGRVIIVPIGFMSDGASWAPDQGFAWLFHDYLYATHCYENKDPCTFDEANKVMSRICKYEGNKTLRALLWIGLKCDIFGKFHRSWINSFIRGPRFLPCLD